MPIISIGAQQHRSIAPGAIARFEHEARIVRNPFNKRNRQLLHDAYGVQLPSLDKQQRTVGFFSTLLVRFHDAYGIVQIPSRHILSGKTTEPLTILPLKSRRNPIVSESESLRFDMENLLGIEPISQDYPVPLTSEDAKRGIISLVERGIIPQGAHITLDPPPIQPKRSNLNDPSSRTKTFTRGATNSFACTDETRFVLIGRGDDDVVRLPSGIVQPSATGVNGPTLPIAAALRCYFQ